MLTNAYEIPFTLAAGASLVLPAGSFEFVYLSSISAGASVRLKGSQVSIDLVVGRRVEFGNPTVQPLTLENNGSGSVSGVLLVGSGDVRDSNVVGTVSVTNADKDRSLSGVAFFGTRLALSVVGQYSVVYLVNPLGSGVRLVVNRVSLSQGSGGAGVLVHIIGDDYTVLEGLVEFSPVGATSFGVNKLVGGAVAKGERRAGSLTSTYEALVPASVADHIFMSAPGVVSTEVFEPFVVNPGGFILSESRTVNDGFAVTWDWFEEPL